MTKNEFLQDQIPECVKDFLSRTASNSPQQEKEKKWVIEPDPLAFEEFCKAFAKGVVYVYRKFGSSPQRIEFVDDLDNPSKLLEEATRAAYDLDTETIYISRRWCNSAVKIPDLLIARPTGRNRFNILEYASLLGVEEAFHHYQVNNAPERSRRRYNATMGQSLSEDPAISVKSPLERDARKVVMMAAQEWGYLPQISKTLRQ